LNNKMKLFFIVLAPLITIALIAGAFPAMAKTDGPATKTFNGKIVRFEYDIKYSIKLDANISGTLGNLPLCTLTATGDISASPTAKGKNKKIDANGTINVGGQMQGTYGVYQYSDVLTINLPGVGQVLFEITLIDTNGKMSAIVTPL
jgi:hypothetical protein